MGAVALFVVVVVVFVLVPVGALVLAAGSLVKFLNRKAAARRYRAQVEAGVVFTRCGTKDDDGR